MVRMRSVLTCTGEVTCIGHDRASHGRSQMKAIVVADRAAGTAGMTLVEQPR